MHFIETLFCWKQNKQYNSFDYSTTTIVKSVLCTSTVEKLNIGRSKRTKKNGMNLLKL